MKLSPFSSRTLSFALSCLSLVLLFGALCAATPAQIQVDLKPFSQSAAALPGAQMYYIGLSSSSSSSVVQSLTLELVTTPLKYAPTAADLPAVSASIAASFDAEMTRLEGFVFVVKPGDVVHSRCFSADQHTVIGYWIDTSGENAVLRFYEDKTGEVVDTLSNFDIVCPLLVTALGAEDLPVIRLTHVDAVDNSIIYAPTIEFSSALLQSSTDLLTRAAVVKVYQVPNTNDPGLNHILQYDFSTIGGQFFSSFTTVFLDADATAIVGIGDAPGNNHLCHDRSSSQNIGRLIASTSNPAEYLFIPSNTAFDFTVGHDIRCTAIVYFNTPAVDQIIRSTHAGEIETTLTSLRDVQIPGGTAHFHAEIHGYRRSVSDLDITLHGISVGSTVRGLNRDEKVLFLFELPANWLKDRFSIAGDECGAGFVASYPPNADNTFSVAFNAPSTTASVTISCFFPVKSTYTGILLDSLNPERPSLYAMASAYKTAIGANTMLPHRDSLATFYPLFFEPPGADYTLTRNDATWPAILQSTASPGGMKLKYEFTITKPSLVPDTNPAFNLQLQRTNAVHLFTPQDYSALISCAAAGPNPLTFSPLVVTFNPLYDRWQAQLNTIPGYQTHRGAWVVRCFVDSYPLTVVNGKVFTETIPVFVPTAFDWFRPQGLATSSVATIRRTTAQATFYNPPTALADFSALSLSSFGTYINTNVQPVVELKFTVAVLHPTLAIDSELSSYADGILDDALMAKFASNRSFIDEIFSNHKTRSFSASKAYSGAHVAFNDVDYLPKYTQHVQEAGVVPRSSLKYSILTPVDLSTDSRPVLVDVVVRYEPADTDSSYTKAQRSVLIVQAADHLSDAALNPLTPFYSQFHLVSSSIAVVEYGVGTAPCGFPNGIINVGSTTTTIRKCQVNDACVYDADCPQTVFGLSVCFAGKCGWRNHAPFEFTTSNEPQSFAIKSTRLNLATLQDYSALGGFTKTASSDPSYVYTYNDVALTDRVLRWRFTMSKPLYSALYTSTYWEFDFSVLPSPYSEHVSISFPPTPTTYLQSQSTYYWQAAVRTADFPDLIQHWFPSSQAVSRLTIRIYEDATKKTLVASDSAISTFFSISPT